jgi:HD-GYP domain-containing protein (c-di-GMP phosphodiesterase class II)
VGLLAIPAEILVQPDPLDDAQRRLLESHVQIGADRVRQLLPDGDWLTDAVAGHHERLDGTGYPGGLREMHISSLARLLAVCDVYAALCCPRPYRPARETRTALTDTLLQAEQGLLDREHAERLLLLSFYPVGTAVELADGSLGVVVATHRGRRELNNAARPVVVLLTDTQGQPLAGPRPLDLAQCLNRSIVRSLSAVERRSLLGLRFPEWA